MFGMTSFAILATCTSWSPLAKELIREIVSASMPFLLSAFRSRRSLASSSLRTTSPRAPMRSSASMVSASGAMGRLLL